MFETAFHVALGAALGLVFVAVIVIAMKTREDHLQRILDKDYMARPEDWGRQ